MRILFESEASNLIPAVACRTLWGRTSFHGRGFSFVGQQAPYHLLGFFIYRGLGRPHGFAPFECEPNRDQHQQSDKSVVQKFSSVHASIPFIAILTVAILTPIASRRT